MTAIPSKNVSVLVYEEVEVCSTCLPVAPEHTSLASSMRTLTLCPSPCRVSKSFLANDVPVIPEPIMTKSAYVGS